MGLQEWGRTLGSPTAIEHEKHGVHINFNTPTPLLLHPVTSTPPPPPPTPPFDTVQDEFCTYMQLEYSKREECALRRKQAAFSLPAKVRRPLTHGEPVLRIHTVSDGTVVTLREDGAVQYWSPDLHLQKTKASVFVRMTIHVSTDPHCYAAAAHLQ